MPTFCYHASSNPVQVGDRILVRSLFSRARLATVVYIPGQSDPDRELGDDQWAYKTDDGCIYAVGYSPAQLPHASKRIGFVSRPGQEAQEVVHSYRIPPEPPDHSSSGRDFLALIGCGTILALTVVVLVTAVGFLWQWFSR